MTLRVPLNPGMGPAVLAHLAKMDELPKFGVVAGQAVASAIEDLWGAGGGVYNDIDVFIPVEYGSMRSTKAAAVPTRFKPVYAESEAYGEMQKYLIQLGTYELETTLRRGLINRIYISISGELRKNDHGKRVITSFDLNCTRVAVDIRSKRLVWDWHYEQFLRTRDLRIVTAHTPVHTFLRLLNKQRQLPNVTVDVETAARTCFVMQEAAIREELRTSRAASFVFGEKYRKLAETLHGDWAPFYDWEDSWLHLRASTSLPDEWHQGPGDETTLEAVELHTLRPRGELESVYKNAAAELGIMSVVVLPTRMYAERDAFKASLVAGHSFEPAASKNPESRLAAFSQARGLDYLKDVESTADWVGLNDFLQRPVGAESFGMTAAEQLEVLAQLKRIAAPLGVPDAAAVLQDAYAQIHGLHEPDLLATARAILEIEKRPWHATPLPVVAELRVNALRAPVAVREVHTLRELRELSHAHGFEPILMAGRSGTDYRYLMLEDGTDRTLLVVSVSSIGKLSGLHRQYNWVSKSAVVNDHHLQVVQELFNLWVAQDLSSRPFTSSMPF